MKANVLSAIPVLAMLAVTPAQGQISGRVRIDIPIGRPQVFVPQYRAPREVRVYDYAPRWDGQWESSYRYWEPITLYLYGGRYYEQPYRNARPIIVYRYQNRMFFAPRDRRFNDFRDRWNSRGRGYDDRDWNGGRGNGRGNGNGNGNGRGDGRYDGRTRPR